MRDDLAQSVREHDGALRRFLRARSGSADDVDDLMQELWIKAAAIDEAQIDSPRAYLFRIANNLVLDHSRQRSRAMARDRTWLSDTAGDATSPELRPDPAPAADEAIASAQEAQVLQDAIAALPAGAQRALRLYRFEGLGQAQIAEVMGISRSGVEKHLALAMQRLRQTLRDCGLGGAAASDRSSTPSIGGKTDKSP